MWLQKVEAGRVLVFEVFIFLDFLEGLGLGDDEAIKIIDDVGDFLADDEAEVDVGAYWEVVHPVDYGPQVSFEDPAVLAGWDPLDELLESEPFDEFPDVDSVVLVDERVNDLEIGRHINEFRLAFDGLIQEPALVVHLVVIQSQASHFLLWNLVQDVAVVVVLHDLQNLDLIAA